MTVIALTGTPGTGKTSVSEGLRAAGYRVIDLSAHINEHDLRGRLDSPRDTYEVDTDALSESLRGIGEVGGAVIMEGHLSHYLECDAIIVLRCHPDVLRSRLESRGYAESKVAENVQAEALDVILCESDETGRPVYEIDCTGGTSHAVAAVEDIIRGEVDRYLPGSVNWGEEMDRWF
ncbi:MAG: adenylate kinase family protein [Candidatus Methanomethylophilaceae archaeon]|mgnify:CR=1 FL=1|nr:adenylate kinase family protein [Candidatus Methanomethylophilaceae archaeon]NLF33329.1 AAA family ATPase [Thermoplasmatales archaeon]